MPQYSKIGFWLSMKLKSGLVLFTTVWEILLTWVITRSLDYFVKWIVRRFRLKPVHLNLNGFMSRQFVFFYLTYIVSFNEREEPLYARLPFFPDMVSSILTSHRRLHRRGVLKTESCRGCNIILRNKSFLKRYEVDEKLYPPFEKHWDD
jgi:hypothetical protein